MRNMVMLAAGLAIAFSTVSLGSAEDEAPKYKIKDVMKVCMKGGLCKKVAAGEGSDEDAKTLHEMFVALSKCKPPKGEAESWEAKTAALVKASKLAVEGNDDASAALQQAANCMECHKAHKAHKGP